MLKGTSSALCLLQLLRADGLQQSSRKSGHCFKALTQSCLKGLYMFVRGWKQKCEQKHKASPQDRCTVRQCNLVLLLTSFHLVNSRSE